MTQQLTCENCKYCLFNDNGYSNYTVEGSDFYCLKRKHPEGSFDRWYGAEEKLNHANECDAFNYGKYTRIEVECDIDNLEGYSDDPEVKVLISNWANWKYRKVW